MSGGSRRDDLPGRFASPPCLAAEIAPDYFDPLAVDPQQALDVARWRSAERKRLRAARLDLTAEARAAAAQVIAAHLDALIAKHLGDPSGRVVSGYWPIKAEPDLRFWMESLHARGARVALPVVEVQAAPLVFRAWHPGMRMERGHWNIPVPPADASRLVPEVSLAPLVGWDSAGYRLGYGGGYFDRTLAALSPRPFVIGVGLHSARIATIFPQPHDVGLDAIVTEAGLEHQASAAPAAP
ncbi:MAG: 5-formyltetrahydrofolate cyclo-ligase [Parvibaculaceae bacterium]